MNGQHLLIAGGGPVGLVTALFLAYGLLGLVDAAFMPAVLWDSGSEATAFQAYERWPAAWKLGFDQLVFWPVGFLGAVAARQRGLLASVIVRASAWIICLGSVFTHLTEFAPVSPLPADCGCRPVIPGRPACLSQRLRPRE